MKPFLALLLLAGWAHAESVTNLPGLVIHGGEKKRVEATGRVALTEGILEFIAVEPTGRDYESVLALDCRPSALKFALLLIGCEPGETNGTHLALEVAWKNKRVPIEEWLIDRRTKKPPAALPWVFTGSYFTKNPLDGRNVFLADEEQAHISLWWQTSILINLARDFGNPYRGDDQGFEVNTKAIPPQGTPVKLILRKRD